tara:strand:- start:15 stop:557 length:543 start_codon:yes stop_codon:yes gene_type:complete
MIEDAFEDIDPSEPLADQTNSKKILTEPDSEQKRQIAEWVNDGMGLSDIQKKINDDFGIVMTYMDVRFLVDDLNLDLVDTEEESNEKTDETTTVEDAQETSVSSLDEGEGGVSVELDTVTPPGAMASGSVTFSDGQNKKWTLDQFGRLGLSGGDDNYKPSDEDVMEFQKKLDSALRGKGF